MLKETIDISTGFNLGYSRSSEKRPNIELLGIVPFNVFVCLSVDAPEARPITLIIENKYFIIYLTHTRP